MTDGRKERKGEKRKREERMDSSSSAVLAQKTWELENNIVSMESQVTNGDLDSIYVYDEAAQSKGQQDRPWSQDPNYFKYVKVSALALLKMVVHARAPGAPLR